MHLDDCATVMTGSSSLRNLTYTPSVACETEYQTTDENCDSVLSSVKSSVKRDFHKRMCQVVAEEDSRSCSCRQSEGMLWQDTETEVDVHSSSTVEEQGRNSVDKYSMILCNQRNKTAQPKIGYESSIEATSASEETLEAQSQCTLSGANLKLAIPQGSRGQHEYGKKRASSMLSKKLELRFSTEAICEIVQSRKEVTSQPVTNELQHVDYVSGVDVASTNQDMSTFHALEKEDCEHVFKKSQWVPFEVPVSQASSDDLSSIHALSTKVSMPPKSSEKTKKQLQVFLEETLLSKAIPEIQEEVGYETKVKDAPCSSSAMAKWWHLQCIEDRNDGELILITIVGASSVTLIILLIVLFAV